MPRQYLPQCGHRLDRRQLGDFPRLQKKLPEGVERLLHRQGQQIVILSQQDAVHSLRFSNIKLHRATPNAAATPRCTPCKPDPILRSSLSKVHITALLMGD